MLESEPRGGLWARAAGAVLLVGFACSRPADPRGASDDAAASAVVGPSAATAATPADDPLERPGYVGVVIAGDKSDVGPPIAGEVMAVHVRPGDYVEAGDPIATLDARRAEEDLRMTKATLRSEKAALGEAEVDREEAASRLAQTEALVKAGAASQGEVEDARFQHRRAKAAEARVAAIVAQWTTKRGQLERQLADTELRAPFSGTVAERYVDPGGMAGPGEPVIRLISSDALWVRFAVPPRDLEGLAVGTIVSTTLEGSSLSIEATVRQIAPETDPASQLVFVDALLDLDERQRASIQAGSASWVRPVGGQAPARAG
ncbi:MAG: efflux RND transporter periplasmic adaptor subunit [Nannocystaceae bacterium]